MSVNRIRKLDIHHRPFITAIYGALSFANKQEFFIEPNIISVHRWQELYLYLKEENYDTLFYSKDLGFFSYEQKPLRLITHPKNRVEEQEKTTVEASTKDYGCKFSRPIFDSPQKDNNEKESANIDNSDSKAYSRIQSVYKPQYGGKLYNLKPQIPLSNIIPDIRCFAETNREFHLTIIITNPEEFTLDSNKEEQITGLLSIHQSATPFNTRLLIVYDAECEDDLVRPWSKEPTPFFYSESIRNIFKRPDDKSQYYFNPSLFYIGKIEEDDILNFLNKRRLDNPVLNSVLFERMSLNEIARKLSIEFPMRDSNSNLIKAGGKQVYYSTNSELNKATDESIIATITSLTSDSAWIRLNKLCGIDDIKQKITDYVQEIKEQLENNIPIHPHLFLSGNPGTGKTTLARLIGEILKEEGILSRGHFVETKPGDFLSDYIGGTRPKTMQKCNEAQGGVLFIDEAYGLYNGKDDQNNQYGKEAVEVLLTYMENVKDMAIIFAGYPLEMEQLLNDSNSGFARRIDEHHRWLIDDYKPESLVKIAKNFFAKGGYTMTPEFEAILPKLYEYKFITREPTTWGNAGSAEGIARQCINDYNKTKRKDKCLDIDCIDPKTFAIIKSMENNPKQKILSADEELESMIGLPKVKAALRGIIDKEEAKKIREKYGYAEESKTNLNFVFKGNPGTGKTTVAGLLGRILAGHGLINAPEVITCTKGDLIDGIVGGGSRNMEKMFKKAVGKVLFIDEAYQLADNDAKDAKDALTNMLTDPRFRDKLAVVLAGYPGDMAELISSNPGLKSRFTQDIFFEDYTNEELTEIFLRKMTKEHFVIQDETLIYAKAYFSSLHRNKEFGNARETEKLRDLVIANQAERLLKLTKPTKEEVYTILPQDFPNFGKINPDKYRTTKETIVSSIEQLNKLIGIDGIRKQFEAYIETAHYCQENPQSKISATFRPHMAFLGNPGTGKSTVARLFAEILRQEGLLTNSNFVEVGPADLIGEYLGQSGPKARGQFERARGGVLFIDEAYQLCRKGQLNGGDQYGKEVITELIKFMEDDRDTVVILAGYTDEIRYLIKKGNPGLASRVTNEFIFEDYTPDILFDILLQKLSEHKMSDDFKIEMRQIIENAYNHRGENEWGNARTIENYAADIFKNFLKKYKAKGVIDCDCIPADLRHNVN